MKAVDILEIASKIESATILLFILFTPVDKEFFGCQIRSSCLTLQIPCQQPLFL
jgi:hypothetical protein